MLLLNRTPFAATHSLTTDLNGAEVLLVVLKATFTISGNKLVLSEQQQQVCNADEYCADPPHASLKQASETALYKQAGDAIVLGSAHKPRCDDRPVDITLRVGSRSKTVRVFGDRSWRGLRGRTPGPAQPFSELPLRWENAFGGRHDKEVELRNPAGRGLGGCGADGQSAALLPNMEYPDQLISQLGDRPAPASFGYVAPSWQPRRSYCGTYDEKWQEKRAPLVPTDFDPRYFQVAPADQIFPGFFRPGLDVEVHNASPAGPLRCKLPEVALSVVVRIGQVSHPVKMELDTLVIDGSSPLLFLTWRGRHLVHDEVYDVEWLKLSGGPS